jgi:hypothetical protein
MTQPARGRGGRCDPSRRPGRSASRQPSHGATVRDRHGIRAGPAATLATSPVRPDARHWVGQVGQADLVVEVAKQADPRSRGRAPAPGPSRDGVEPILPSTVQVLRHFRTGRAGSAEHRSGSAPSRSIPSSRTPRMWPERRAPDRLASPLLGRQVRNVDGAEVELPRPDAGGAGEQPRSRALPTKLGSRAFLPPGRLASRLALARTAARAMSTSGDGVTAPGGRVEQWPERDGDHGAIERRWA